MHIHIHIHVYINIRVHIHIHVYIHIRIHIHLHVYTLTHAHIQTLSDTHTYTYTCKHTSLCERSAHASEASAAREAIKMLGKSSSFCLSFFLSFFLSFSLSLSISLSLSLFPCLSLFSFREATLENYLAHFIASSPHSRASRSIVSTGLCWGLFACFFSFWASLFFKHFFNTLLHRFWVHFWPQLGSKILPKSTSRPISSTSEVTSVVFQNFEGCIGRNARFWGPEASRRASKIDLKSKKIVFQSLSILC